MADCDCGGSLFSHDPDCAMRLEHLRAAGYVVKKAGVKMPCIHFVVIDWDREEVVGSAESSILAQDIKEQHCDDVGIARDNEHDEPRHRVTIERIEVK